MAFVDYWPDLLDAIKSIVLLTWPELADDQHGVWESTESARVSISRKQWPIGVIQLLNAREGEWGLHKVVWEQPVAIWYVAQTASGRQAPLRSKLKALQNALITDDRQISANDQSFQTARFIQFDLSMNNEGNIPWFVRNTGFQSGAIVPVFLCGDNEG